MSNSCGELARRKIPKLNLPSQNNDRCPPFFPLDRNFLTFFTLNPFPEKALFFTCLQNTSFENTVGKGEKCS